MLCCVMTCCAVACCGGCSQYQLASTLEAKRWTPELAQEAVEKAAAEIRAELEPKLLHNVNNKVGYSNAVV